jgi:hypothetical protein
MLSEAILRIARGELGNGEEGKNNAGFHVNKYRQGRDVHGAWCARFLYWCTLQACWATGRRRCIVRPTGSARVLAKRLLRKGRRVKIAKPGDILLLDRVGGKHICIVETVDAFTMNTIDGNRGKYPAQVARFHYRHDDPDIEMIIRLNV